MNRYRLVSRAAADARRRQLARLVEILELAAQPVQATPENLSTGIV